MIIPPELQDEETVILSKIRSGERVEHFETVRLRKDGSRVDISLTVSPIRTPDGTIIGLQRSPVTSRIKSVPKREGKLL